MRVVIVAGICPEDGPFGFTVSTITSVSVEPPLVSICVDRGSRGLTRLRRAGRFSINLLADHQGALARRFGAPEAGPFQGVRWRAADTGTPILAGVIVVMLCVITKEVEAGDHQIVIAEAERLALRGGEPLVYWRRGLHRVHREYPFLASPAALAEFVRTWEAGLLPPREWTHTAHVGVAAYYAFAHPPEVAFEMMKSGILRHNTCVGTPNTENTGYHETLTRFWWAVVGGFVSRGSFHSPFEAARHAVEVLGEDRDCHRLYYSFDVVRDRRARREWIKPDRVPPLACPR